MTNYKAEKRVSMTIFVAVETSDIVGSTLLTSEQLSHVMKGLREYLDKYQQDKNAIVEFYRGDAYQILYKNPVNSFRKLLLIKLYLLSHFDLPVLVTQSLAIGGIPAPVTQLNDRMDKVFIASGRQLETLSSAQIGVDPEYFSSAFTLATQFFNRMLEGMSAKQALVVYWYINDNFPEQKKIAERLDMTRQNVNTHLLRANIDLIRHYLEYFETTVKELSL